MYALTSEGVDELDGSPILILILDVVRSSGFIT